jgi:Glutathione peroxidase
MKESFYDFKANDINGKEVSMSSYEGKVVLIVNVASGCGFTPQYEGLQKLYDEHKEEGLEILAFPCNQFGEQEKGDGEEIKNFCEKNYSITFPIFEKVEVNGNDAHPIFKFIKEQKKGFMGTESIKWNFSKFLLSKNGEVIKRYGSLDVPENLEADIKQLLTA